MTLREWLADDPLVNRLPAEWAAFEWYDNGFDDIFKGRYNDLEIVDPGTFKERVQSFSDIYFADMSEHVSAAASYLAGRALDPITLTDVQTNSGTDTPADTVENKYFDNPENGTVGDTAYINRADKGAVDRDVTFGHVVTTEREVFGHADRAEAAQAIVNIENFIKGMLDAFLPLFVCVW